MRYMTSALLLTAFLSTAANEADQSRFLNTDIFELEVAAEPQISPDGSQIAYVRQSMDIMSDRARSNVWLVNANLVTALGLLSIVGVWNVDGHIAECDRIVGGCFASDGCRKQDDQTQTDNSTDDPKNCFIHDSKLSRRT